MKRNKHTLPPDPEYMNDERAGWAEEAIRTFQRETNTDDCDAVADLLCDLMHACDRRGETFDESLRKARYHYAEETGAA